MNENYGFADQAEYALLQSWETHRQAFGPILDPAFQGNLQSRIHLTAALNLISNRKLKEGMEKLQLLKDCCVTNADQAVWWFFMGVGFEFAGAREQMLACYEQAGRFKHGLYLPYLKLAKAAHAGGDYETAERYYREGIRCLKEAAEEYQDDTILASVYANLASCFIMDRRYEEAEWALEESKLLAPKFPGRGGTEAILYALLKQPDKVRERLETLKREEPQLYGAVKAQTDEILGQ